MKSAFVLVFVFLCLWCAEIEAHPVAQGMVVFDVQRHELLATFRVSNEQVFVASTFGKTTTKPSNSPTLENLWHDHSVYLLERVQVKADGSALKGQLISVKEPQDFTVNGFTEYVLRFPFPSASPKSLRIAQSLLSEIEFAPGNPWETTFNAQIKQEGRIIDETRRLTNKQPLEIALQWSGVSSRHLGSLATGISFAAFAAFVVNRLYSRNHSAN